METPPPDPVKLRDIWERWEKGEILPGKTLAELKTAGMPDLLASLASKAE